MKSQPSEDDYGPPNAKRRKSRWGVVEGGASTSPARVMSPTKSTQEQPASGFADEGPPQKAPVDVKKILERIGDVSMALNRARALKGASLLPKHATLKINKTLKDPRTVKLDTKLNFSEGPLKLSKLAKRPAALRFINRGYFMSKQKALERKLEAKGVDLRPAARVLNEVDAQKTESESAIALSVAQEFVGGRDRKWKREKKQLLKADSREDPARHDSVNMDQSSGVELDWWDKAVLKAVEPQIVAVKDAKLLESFGPNISKLERELCEAERGIPFTLKEGAITHLIQHPEVAEPLHNASDVTPPVFLTTSEKKRMRRQRNKEREQDKRDKIQMGLMDPPPPKVKLSNLMRVLGESAAANPTAVEASVRKQVADRLKAHEARTAKARLSEEARRAKTVKKWVAPHETNEMVQVVIFQLKDITNKQCLFKVHQNAKELHLTGAAALCPGQRNIVVVEGSSKAIKKYKAVLLRRIQWPNASGSEQKSVIDAIAGGGDILDPFCVVVWEGPMKAKAFKHWNTYPCPTIEELEQLFERNSAGHYWKIIERFRAPQQDLL